MFSDRGNQGKSGMIEGLAACFAGLSDPRRSKPAGVYMHRQALILGIARVSPAPPMCAGRKEPIIAGRGTDDFGLLHIGVVTAPLCNRPCSVGNRGSVSSFEFLQSLRRPEMPRMLVASSPVEIEAKTEAAGFSQEAHDSLQRMFHDL